MTRLPEMPGVPAAELNAERRVLRKLVDNLPALVAYWDRDRHNVVANAAYLEWFGFTPEQIRGRHMREVLGEDVYAKNLPFIDAAYRGESQHFDRTLVDPRGRIRHSQADYIPEMVDETVVGMFVLVTDTTEKVEAQRQLDEAQAVARVGSWVLYPETGELQWSREMFLLIGADPDHDEPSIELWQSRIHPDDQAESSDRRTAAIENREAFDLHYRMVRPDGSVRYFRSRGAPALDSEGRTIRLVGTIQDETDIRLVTDQLRAGNEQLAAANALLSDTVTMLGHDVQQPIQASNGFLEFTLDAWESLDDGQRRENIRRALASGMRLRTLVQDILTLMNVESGRVRVRARDVEIRGSVIEAIDAVAPGDERIEVDIDPSVVAHVDPFHLRQIVSNLLGNAVKYGAPPFEVTARADSDAVIIEVGDHGEGVPEEFVPHLFDRFTRAGSGTAATQSGSGFGLYLARSLAEANGGTLTYAPHATGGSRFRVTLTPA